MSAWVAPMLLLGGALTALWMLNVRGGRLLVCAAALFAGAVGYAFQASPNAARPSEAALPPHPLTGARHAFFGSFSPVEHWLRLSEALARSGNTADSAGILQNAVKRYPTDAHLWVGLGNALVDHGGRLTPPAELAYRRAREVLPGHPAAPFFHGLALARSGNRPAAVAEWRGVLATAPADASWRPLVEQGIERLSRTPR